MKAKDTISPQERDLVKQTSTRLIGLEIVEEDFTRIVLQCLLEPAASLPMKILRREYNIAASMHRDAVSAFLSNDVNLARNVIARDVEVNRFYFLLVRTLRTVIQNPNLGVKLNIRSIDCLDYRLCASLVETIGDRAVVIANKVLALKDSKISKEISQLIGAFHSMVFKNQKKALKAFFEHDVTLAEEVRCDRLNVENKFNAIESAVKEQADQIIPIIPEGVSIPAPTDMNYIQSYLAYLLTDEKTETEDYTYGERLVHPKVKIPAGQNLHQEIPVGVNQVEEVIRIYKQEGFGTNQAVMEMIRETGQLVVDVDLTGREVSSTSIDYPEAGFGWMEDDVKKGYQAALTTLVCDRWQRLMLTLQIDDISHLLIG